MNRTLLITALVLALAALVMPARGYEVYTVTPAVSNWHIPAEGPLPPTCRAGSVLRLMACRGEAESASFLVDAPGPLQAVRVAVTGLSAFAPDLHLIQRVPMSNNIGTAPIPWVLVHDPGMLELVKQTPAWVQGLKEADWPEVNQKLVSLADYKAAWSHTLYLRKPLRDAATLLPVDIAQREQFLLTVTVPADAEAGIYRGTVTITPANAAATVLPVELWVPDVDLKPAPYTYSIYHPTDHINPPLTDTQLLDDFTLMAAYGLDNPNMYAGPDQDEPGGEIKFTRLNRYMDLREKAGLPKGALYLMDGAGLIIAPRPLTDAERRRTTEVAAATVAWARGRGYGPVYFMGADEASGDLLTAQRESWEAVRAGGARIFAAGYYDMEKLVGDLLGCMVIMHPDALRADQNEQWQFFTRDKLFAGASPYFAKTMLADEFRDVIAKQHARGAKVFTYMDPVGGMPWPDSHRRLRGAGLWQSGLDGTMTWAWTHYRAAAITDDQVGQETGISYMGPVTRGPEASLVTLALVSYREGHDDARYIATVEAAGGGAWLRSLPWETGDLDVLRRQMVQWILAH